jgi:diguanylate cyclase (GGDEF)-like protein
MRETLWATWCSSRLPGAKTHAEQENNVISSDSSERHTEVGEQHHNRPAEPNVQRRRTDQQAADTRGVIPFPAEQATLSGAETETGGPRIFSLPLRKALREAMQPVLRRARIANELVGCLVLELDSYREIEETFGHQLAEELSGLVEERLVDSLRAEDIVYQVAHNEFVILLDRLEQREQVAHIARRLLAHCTGGYHIAGVRLTMKGRVGVAVYPYDSTVPETLLRYARVALREARPQRGEHCRFFSPEQLDRLRDRVQMAAEIEQAIEQHRVVLHYQPQYAIDTQRIIGVEALVRLQGSDGKLITPDQFIELAEETGLIVPLGRHVLEEACQQLARWRRAGCGPLRMAVNIAPRQLLEPDFIELVDQAVARAGIAHADLELEITERQVVEYMSDVEQTLRALTERGVRIAIDDFGTGYSSLAYLMQLSVTTVKIDRAFMTQIPKERRAERIVTAIVAMAGALGLTLTAEGIETAEQHQFLLEAGCQLGQGFGFARPQDAESIKQYL